MCWHTMPLCGSKLVQEVSPILTGIYILPTVISHVISAGVSGMLGIIAREGKKFDANKI